MKRKNYFLVALILFLIGIIICGDRSWAENKELDLLMGQKSHVSITNDDVIFFNLPDGNGKVRVNISNVLSSGTFYKFENYQYVGYPFSNDPNYNRLDISFVNIYLNDSVQTFSVEPGQASVSFDLELVQEHKERFYIYIDNHTDYDVRIKNASFDIEIQPTESWVAKTENKQGQQEEVRFDQKKSLQDEKEERSKVRGKILKQTYAYSRKCEIEIDVKDQKKVRLYRKSSRKGKYKFVKQMYNGEELSYETFYDKGLKPNKQYWYKIETLDWDDKLWSEKSSSESFWTAPEKVKVKRSGNTLRWNKSKGAVGYMVVESWHTEVGYNIFWQVLTDYIEKSYLTKKRSYTFKHNVDDYDVYAIAKHKGKYYANDYEGNIFKKMSSFKFTNSKRYAG
ncbi:MAG: hypothetical protein HFG34_00980 [Eubacterium sp.]|nr:hypothetical protein [Eubacterium sp.]